MKVLLPGLKVLAAEASASVEVGTTAPTLVVLLLSSLLISLGIYLTLRREQSF